MAKPNSVSVYQEHEENKQIRRDLWTVIILNAIFFGLLLALYFVNRSSGVVDQFFGKFLNF